MGSIRDAATTRARIIAAAVDEFGRHGSAGARVDRIARAARVNKRMLYHYFGDKARLYRAALEAALAAGERAAEAAGLAEQLAAAQAGYAGDPARARLLMWEALSTGAGAIVGEHDRALVWRRNVERLRAEQRAGKLALACAPEQLALAVLALALFPFAFPQLTRLIARRAPEDPEFLAAQRELFDALAALLERGAAPPAGPSTSGARKPRYRLTATVS